MIRMECVGRSFPSGARAVRDISLTVERGSILGLIGSNGSGKSSCARILCAMDLADEGSAIVDGIDPAAGEPDRLAVREMVAYVQQDPVDQLVSTIVFDEVAFGPRNLGLDEGEVERRVRGALAAVDLAGSADCDVAALSGGEQQRLAIAGALAMNPRYLVLDEVTAMLDSAVRPSFRELIASRAEAGTGVVLVTHDVSEMALCDRLLALEGGQAIWRGDIASLASSPDGLWDRCVVPTGYSEALRAALRAGVPREACVRPESLARAVLGISGGLEAIFQGGGLCEDALPLNTSAAPQSGRGPSPDDGIAFARASYSYAGADDDARLAVSDASLSVPRGEVVLLAGRSGSGKSTMASLACGLLTPDAGSVALFGRAPEPASCGVSFQRPENQLFLDSVFDELAFALRNQGGAERDIERRVRTTAARLGIDEELFDRSPFELSGGQARRVGLGCVLSLDAPAYVFDEPTAGLDARGRVLVHRLMRGLAEEGRAVLVISHDLEEWMGAVDSVALMRDGSICWQGDARRLATAPAIFREAGIEPPEGALLREALAYEGGGHVG